MHSEGAKTSELPRVRLGGDEAANLLVHSTPPRTHMKRGEQFALPPSAVNGHAKSDEKGANAGVMLSPSKRCKLSREQLAVLIKSFEEEPLPNFDQQQAMAKALGMTPRSVQIWSPVHNKQMIGGMPRQGRLGGLIAAPFLTVG